MLKVYVIAEIITIFNQKYNYDYNWNKYERYYGPGRECTQQL